MAYALTTTNSEYGAGLTSKLDHNEQLHYATTALAATRFDFDAEDDGHRWNDEETTHYSHQQQQHEQSKYAEVVVPQQRSRSRPQSASRGRNAHQAQTQQQVTSLDHSLSPSFASGPSSRRGSLLAPLHAPLEPVYAETLPSESGALPTYSAAHGMNLYNPNEVSWAGRGVPPPDARGLRSVRREGEAQQFVSQQQSLYQSAPAATSELFSDDLENELQHLDSNNSSRSFEQQEDQPTHRPARPSSRVGFRSSRAASPMHYQQQQQQQQQQQAENGDEYDEDTQYADSYQPICDSSIPATDPRFDVVFAEPSPSDTGVALTYSAAYGMNLYNPNEVSWAGGGPPPADRVGLRPASARGALRGSRSHTPQPPQQHGEFQSHEAQQYEHDYQRQQQVYSTSAPAPFARSHGAAAGELPPLTSRFGAAALPAPVFDPVSGMHLFIPTEVSYPGGVVPVAVPAGYDRGFRQNHTSEQHQQQQQQQHQHLSPLHSPQSRARISPGGSLASSGASTHRAGSGKGAGKGTLGQRVHVEFEAGEVGAGLAQEEAEVEGHYERRPASAIRQSRSPQSQQQQQHQAPTASLSFEDIDDTAAAAAAGGGARSYRAPSPSSLRAPSSARGSGQTSLRSPQHTGLRGPAAGSPSFAASLSPPYGYGVYGGAHSLSLSCPSLDSELDVAFAEPSPSDTAVPPSYSAAHGMNLYNPNEVSWAGGGPPPPEKVGLKRRSQGARTPIHAAGGPVRAMHSTSSTAPNSASRPGTGKLSPMPPGSRSGPLSPHSPGSAAGLSPSSAASAGASPKMRFRRQPSGEVARVTPMQPGSAAPADSPFRGGDAHSFSPGAAGPTSRPGSSCGRPATPEGGRSCRPGSSAPSGRSFLAPLSTGGGGSRSASPARLSPGSVALAAPFGGVTSGGSCGVSPSSRLVPRPPSARSPSSAVAAETSASPVVAAAAPRKYPKACRMDL